MEAVSHFNYKNFLHLYIFTTVILLIYTEWHVISLSFATNEFTESKRVSEGSCRPLPFQKHAHRISRRISNGSIPRHQLYLQQITNGRSYRLNSRNHEILNLSNVHSIHHAILTFMCSKSVIPIIGKCEQSMRISLRPVTKLAPKQS